MTDTTGGPTFRLTPRWLGPTFTASEPVIVCGCPTCPCSRLLSMSGMCARCTVGDHSGSGEPEDLA